MRPHRLAPGLLTVLAALAAAAVPAPAAAGPTTGRLLVTLEAGGPGHAARTARAPLAAAGARIAGPVQDRLRLVTVRPRAGLGAHAVAVALRGLPQVQSVEVERRATLRLDPGDPALTTPEGAAGTPAGTSVQWWALRQNLPAMWDITRGTGATVAVIDTGIDATHPELAAKITGLIDNDSTSGAGGAGTDEIGHGTHVGSLACAGAGNGLGFAGTGLDCSLLIIKSDLSDSSVAASIVQAVDAGADAINMSFGTDGSQPAASAIVRAIDYAVEQGVVLVAAAADEPVEEQGDPSNVLQPTGSGADITQGKGLSVTSASFTGERSAFAGLGTQVSIAAFGSFASGAGPRGIFGAFPRNATDLERVTLFSPGCGCRTSFAGDSRYAYIQGTSMASPMVAAVAAVVRRLNPDLSAADVIRVLKQSATRPSGGGWTPELGWGILNGGAAAGLARVIDRRPPRSSVRSPRRVVRGDSVTLRLTTRDAAPKGCVASGVKTVEVWRGTNGGRPHRIARTTASTLKVTVNRGSRYRFYTRAVDKAGNREAVPPRADTTVRGTTH